MSAERRYNFSVLTRNAGVGVEGRVGGAVTLVYPPHLSPALRLLCWHDMNVVLVVEIPILHKDSMHVSCFSLEDLSK